MFKPVKRKDANQIQKNTTSILPPNEIRFYIKATELSYSPNTWSYTHVDIFDRDQGDIKIGEYTKNYPHGGDTFFPFKRKDGKWFALYSENYHSTNVMSLPDCKKIAECDSGPRNKFDSSGFCPVNYWVPFICAYDMNWGKEHIQYGKPQNEIMWFDPESDGLIDGVYDKIAWHHLDIGFVWGCYWAAEFEIAMLDLSKIETGVLLLKRPFCPSDLPRKIPNFQMAIEPDVDNKGIMDGVKVLGKYYKLDENNNFVET